jgi:hypothetical protein
MTSRKGGTALKKWFFAFMLLTVPVLVSQLAVAQKTSEKEAQKETKKESVRESHKDYADMKIADCNSCHKGEGVAPTHNEDWLHTHKTLAKEGQKNCTNCHEQSFCLDCHQGGGIDAKLSTKNYRADYSPKSHRSDWLEIHPLKAKDNPQYCTRCHDQKYCIQCHSKFKPEKLQFRSHRRQFSDINLTSIGPNHANFSTDQCQICHPNSFLPTHVWSTEHAVEARRNIQSCQSCHSEGDVCLKCHSAKTGLRVNPHPRNWNSIRGNFKNKSSSRTCVVCHNAGTF